MPNDREALNEHDFQAPQAILESGLFCKQEQLVLL